MEGWREWVGAKKLPAPGVDREDPAAEALLVASARRDPAAFAPLYRLYFDPVYRYCLRSLGDREAAADATQDVFARALTALPHTEIGAFRPWLFAIAHNALTDRQRQSARRPVLAPLDDAEERADPAPTPEEAALSAEARRSVHRLLVQLTDDQRAVVELRLADLTGPEVAGILGRSVGSVKVAQHRAFRRLRDLIAAESGNGEHHATR